MAPLSGLGPLTEASDVVERVEPLRATVVGESIEELVGGLSSFLCEREGNVAHRGLRVAITKRRRIELQERHHRVRTLCPILGARRIAKADAPACGIEPTNFHGDFARFTGSRPIQREGTTAGVEPSSVSGGCAGRIASRVIEIAMKSAATGKAPRTPIVGNDHRAE